MDNENTSNTKSEAFPEKVDAYVGVSADHAMIERVGGREGNLKRGSSDSEGSSDESEPTKPAKQPGSTSPRKGEDEEEEFKIPERFSKNGRRKAVSFPLKLMKILSTKKYADIICWLPGGKSFAVVDQDRFTAEVLPVHFKQAKYTSFTRKLLRWGFTRIKAGTYTHELFQKNRLDMVEQMSCKSNPAPPSSSVNISGYGFPGPMMSAHHQYPVRQPQSLSMGSLAALPHHEATIAHTHQQDALTAVDREINRVRRLLQEKRLEAASASFQQPFVPQLPPQQQQQQLPGPMSMSQLPMSQPQLSAIGGMGQATPSVASLPNPEAQSPSLPAAAQVEIELEVRRRLRLREQGISMGMDTSPSALLREQGLGRGMEAASMAALREQQGLNRGMEAASMASLREQPQGLARRMEPMASLPRGMMPMSPQQQHQLQQHQLQQQMMGSRGSPWAAAANPNLAYMLSRGNFNLPNLGGDSNAPPYRQDRTPPPSP